MHFESTVSWFCLRTQPKHEHIAAAHLLQDGIEVYLPRIRFRKPTREGPAWFTEALFPNYLFARFALADGLRRVNCARGVQGVVHFGEHWPSVPDGDIAGLQATFPDGKVQVVEDSLAPGEAVLIIGGAFNGLVGLVQRVLPARERVAVLLDLLGRQTCVELPAAVVVIPEMEPRKKL